MQMEEGTQHLKEIKIPNRRVRRQAI